MRCDGSADPTISGEINTYINLQREDKSNESIEAALTATKHTREVRNSCCKDQSASRIQCAW